MLNLLAHAEELHTTSTTSAEHILTQWFVAIPLFLIVVAGLTWLLSFGFKIKLPILILVLIALCFVTGVSMISLVPALSALALTVGMAMALLLVTLNLSQP